MYILKSNSLALYFAYFRNKILKISPLLLDRDLLATRSRGGGCVRGRRVAEGSRGSRSCGVLSRRAWESLDARDRLRESRSIVRASIRRHDAADALFDI